MLWTRRKFLISGASGLAGVVAADSLFIAPYRPIARQVEIHLKRLPEAFDRFRIAQISDVHFGPYMDRAGVERGLDLARGFQPDLLIFTGDFVSHSLGESHGPNGAHHAEPFADAVANSWKLSPVIAILGNHDHWNGAEIVSRALIERGITLLRNAALPVERATRRLWFAGVDDVYAGAADLGRAIRQIPGEEATILLAHEPDFADYASRYPIDLQLSGHSHGGQVRLPGIGALILPSLAHKYPMGLNRVGPMQVYTSCGLGVISPPVRFNCPPEVTLLTLLRDRS
jgi:predicted MPP superfamily phosphohydrolase